MNSLGAKPRSHVSNAIAAYVITQLSALADPDKAAPMAAYMKTTVPFYGVQSPARERIAKDLVKRFEIGNRRDYERTVRQLWKLPHREEKYLAIEVAIRYTRFVVPASLPLYRMMIRNGGWWDYVDPIAIALVGKVYLDERDSVSANMDKWAVDDNLWIRRTALIAHNRHKNKTDHRRLFRYCRQCFAEQEFFIRKAIGWALREYSYSAPERVARFLLTHHRRMSGLSFREGAKALRRKGFKLHSPD